MHHTFLFQAHPLFLPLRREKATLSRLTPTGSARRVHPSREQGVMDAG
jgi:hypothetical protein